MQLLTIVGVEPGPILRFDSGETRTTIYSGVVRFQRNTGFRGVVMPGATEPCSFFVPDSEAYTEAPPVLAVETSLRSFRTLGNPGVVAFGTQDAQVAVVPDPRGTGHSWLQVTFSVPTSSFEQAEINYRITAQAPA